jgi:hypothetical protein
VTLALLAASLLSGAADRLPPELRDPALAFYLDMGGSPEELCGSTGHEGAPPGRCDACRLIGAAVLPEPGVSRQLRRACAWRRVFASPAIPLPSPLDRSRSPRGPPAVA